MLAENQTQGTIGEGGKRLWVYPQEIRGFFVNRRRIVAWLLLILYLGLPWLRFHGQAIFLIDASERRLLFFGQSFWPQDLAIFLPLVIAFILGVFLVTMLWGRIWCGWACPQTVFLQFLFAPIEKLIEGSATIRKRRDAAGVTFDLVWRKIAKFFIFFIVSLIISNTFLAYFFGSEWVIHAMQASPSLHPASFVFVAAFGLVFFYVFAYFKEQACIVVCPYAKFQSALTDSNTKIISYDSKRGELRGKPSKEKESSYGDCVNCRLCVQVCPTGIDIRDGQQLECIGCSRCIDACDKIMTAWKRPKGLVRYATLNELGGVKVGLSKFRIAVYSSLIVILLISFVSILILRKPFAVDLVRKGTLPYFIMPGDSISNIYTLKIRNRRAVTAAFSLKADVSGTFTFSDEVLRLQPGELNSYTISFKISKKDFQGGRRKLKLRISTLDENGMKSVEQKIETVLLGPFSS